MTFDQRWRKEKIISPTSAQIAAVGFFFLKRGDVMKYWHCGRVLGGWRYDDDPWEVHAKWYPTCQFVMREKGVGFIFHLVRQYPNLARLKIYTEDVRVKRGITTTTAFEKRK